ncbi:unnamed protein product [Rotaria sp. Silwood2]|nr:unnamed protein product [Rotaria sp. Silwood2]CAF3117857.1 unnamed protein product [Rotaria sp. Silwood2]CAF4755537.1 unnamed protein product [Rotaria sp. Silwood2]CAF4851884.1 unnamed protein product [Rotaria sp. Silwood2]CAF4934823.1 unnamed protein product [Rotaria sp. Silwood2]
MDVNIEIDDLDKLTSRKIHEMTTTSKSTILLLQKLKLLPTLPTTIEQCGQQNNHAWYFAEYSKSNDGK